MTPERLAEIKDYCAKANGIDWKDGTLIGRIPVYQFLSRAWTDLPLLVEAYEGLQQDLQDAELFLMRQDYKRCDIAACNCGSWHKRTQP